jgi:hexokinase
MHDLNQVQQRSIEQVISMVTTSKTAIPHKLLSVQEKMDIINMGGTKLRISLTEKKKGHSRTLHFNVVST